jgi:tellurite resistance protein TehA-like permease
MTIKRNIAYVAAVAFAVAAGWYALVAENVTVAAPPRFVPTEPVDVALHRWFAWFVTTLPQERLNTAIAIVAMLCLAALGAFLGRLPGYAVALGAVVWTIGHVLQLGGHRAVGLMATHSVPIETVNAINFTVDTITETFELTAFALIGSGLLGLAAMTLRHHVASRTWAVTTAVLGAAMLALAVGYATGADDLVIWLQAGGGLILLPTWLIWTAHVDLGPSIHNGRSGDGPTAESPAVGATSSITAHR